MEGSDALGLLNKKGNEVSLVGLAAREAKIQNRPLRRSQNWHSLFKLKQGKVAENAASQR